MKVTMFAAPFGQRGQMHIHCKRYVRLLQLAGCAITLVEHSGAQSPVIAGVDHRRYPRRMRRLDNLVTSRALSFLHKRRLEPVLKSAQADLCHVQWLDDRVLDISRAGGHPLVATGWGSDLNVPAQAPASDPVRQRIGAALRSLDLLIVDCDAIAETARTLAGVEVPTALLPIGIDTTLFQPNLPDERRRWRAQLQIEPDAIVFLSARQLGAVYRPEEIIKAFATVPGAVRDKSYLIIRTFGHSVGTSLADLQRLAQELGLAQRVKWVGGMAYEKQPGLYAAADVTVNFPAMDAFPVTILESLACGIPVLTNRLEAYESNGAMPYLTFTAEDSASQLGATMAAAAHDLPALQAIATAGRAHVVQNFDERVSAVRLKEIYDELLVRVQPAADRKRTMTA
jgi:glycosyltransferase involved in cell wall biosynthesis